MVFLVKVVFLLGLLSACQALKVGSKPSKRPAKKPGKMPAPPKRVQPAHSGRYGMYSDEMYFEPSGCPALPDMPPAEEPAEEHSIWVSETLLDALPSVVIGAGEVGNIEDAHGSVLIWAWAQGEGEMRVELYPNGKMEDAVNVFGPYVSDKTGYTGRTVVTGLLPGTMYHYTVTVGDDLVSEMGTFKTAPLPEQPVAFGMEWFACIAGQHFGLSSEIVNDCKFGEKIEGGYVLIGCALQLKPDAVYTMGDIGYQIGTIPAVYDMEDAIGGGTWLNDLATKEYSAVTLNEFRQTYHYNLYDASFRRLYRDQAVWATWDDHEITNDWYAGMVIYEYTHPDDCHDVSIDLLPHGTQAFYEFTPIHTHHPVHKAYRYGKHFQLISLDTRTFRGSTDTAHQPDPQTMLGSEQLAWLKSTLRESTATWKVIGTSGPIGITTGGDEGPDSWASGEHEMGGREWEMAEILSFIKAERIKNVVWISSDVHWSSVWYYQPERAEGGFHDFDPFYEFVCGPTHAGAFLDGNIDNTFGGELLFSHSGTNYGFTDFGAPPPNGGCIGWLGVSETGVFTMRYYHTDGELMFEKELLPEQ